MNIDIKKFYDIESNYGGSWQDMYEDSQKEISRLKEKISALQPIVADKEIELPDDWKEVVWEWIRNYKKGVQDFLKADKPDFYITYGEIFDFIDERVIKPLKLSHPSTPIEDIKDIRVEDKKLLAIGELEEIRLYAESRMVADWDRKDPEMVGVFYQYYIEKLIQKLS